MLCMENDSKRGRGRPKKDASEHSRIKSINLTVEQKAALTAYSRAVGKSMSALVDEWIREELDEAKDL